MLFDNYSGITLNNTNLSTSNTQAPIPRLIIGYQEIPARLSPTTPAVNYGRCMAFVTNVLILEPIVYCAALPEEDKIGMKRVK